MKKRGLIIAVVAVLFSILITLTGCDDKEEEKIDKNNIRQAQSSSVEKNKKVEFKEGTYEFVPEADGEEVLEDSLFVEFKDGKITLTDGFAGLVQEGTYEVNGGKIVGTYTSMTYIDHSKGGEYTTKDINDKIEMYILEDGSLRDFVGYGISLDNNMMKDAKYKLSEEN